MAKFWKDIMLPVVIVGAVAAQTIGVETSRAVRLHAWSPLPPRDSVISNPPDSLPANPPDSLAGKQTDSLLSDDGFDLFAEPVKDTTPRIMARDTMKVPDSLKLTDPFLYQWYVAVKDSFTHRSVIDSLKAEGDSLIWPRIDSLYLADSTLQVKLAWERKWNAMSKAERKRWTYEHVELPAIRHRQDSILHYKDSIRNRKDSIRQATPRVLETAFLPDSLYFKRLVTWRHGRLYNNVEIFDWDTTANYHFYDYPFMHKDVGASWVGMPGTAVQEYNYFRRGEESSVSFYRPVESWTYTPENLPQFNTKTPYTELEYYGNLFSSSTLASDAFRVFTTQNILPSLNIALEMKRYGGAGILQNQHSDNRNYFVAGNYVGRKYLAHGGLIMNKITHEECGGIQDNMWIRDTTVDVREISVNLAKATNRYKKLTLFYDQSYRIPFEFIDELRHRGDSTWVRPDTLNTDMTTGFIGTTTEYTTYTKKYVDNTSDPLSAFYRDIFYINPSKSTDSLRTMRLENRIFVRLQPWKEDAIVSKVEGGIGDRLQSFFLQQPGDVFQKPANHKWNALYVYGGAEGRFSKYFRWDATGQYTFAGHEANDFFIQGNAALSLFPFHRHPDSPMTLQARFETSLREPEFYQQHFYSNHFAWENDFSKISETRLTATFSVPRWQFKAHAGYSLLAGYVYYDNYGIPRQENAALSALSAGLSKDFVFGPVHLENAALMQLSSNQDVLPLPLLALNLRWYLQLNVVDPKVLKLQAGVNTRYTTLWYAPGYNPVAGVFTNQTEEKYGNCPVFDVFLNLQWKKCSIFFKFENAGQGWPMDKHDYFTAHHYIQPAGALKFGISWPFYPRLEAARTLSSRASSGLGGSGGGGGFGGGLGGSLGGGLGRTFGGGSLE